MSNLVFPLAALGAYIDQRAPYLASQTDEAAGGNELRSTWWLAHRVRFVVKVEMTRSDAGSRQDYQQLMGHLERHFSQLESFLLSDPEDNQVADCGFGVGDGVTTAFQLQRSLAGSMYDQLGGPWPTVTKPRTNLALWSQDLTNAAWLKVGGGTGTAPLVMANQGLAPDGTPTASLGIYVQGSGATLADFSLTQSSAYSPPVPQTLTWSVWLKSADANSYAVYLAIAGSGGSIKIVTVTPQWQRFSVTLLVATAGARGYLGLRGGSAGTSTPANSTANLLVWGAQFEVAAAPTRYIATTTVALTDTPSYWPIWGSGFAPVYDLDPPPAVFLDNDWQGRRQVFPYARTNLHPFSEQWDNAAYTKTNFTVGANATTAPDGNATADQLGEGVALGLHKIEVAPTSAEVAGQFRCYSVYLKAGTLPNVVVRTSTPADGVSVNLGTGVLDAVAQGAPIAKGIITLPNGWFRVWFTRRVVTPSATLVVQGCVDNTYNIVSNYTGTSRTCFVWGGMVELVADPFAGPSGYVPTPSSTGVTVTDFSLSALGQVTFSSPPAGLAWLSWSGSYFTRCRWDDAKGLDWQRIVRNMWGGEIRLVSTRPSL